MPPARRTNTEEGLGVERGTRVLGVVPGVVAETVLVEKHLGIFMTCFGHRKISYKAISLWMNHSYFKSIIDNENQYEQPHLLFLKRHI